jgi:pyruvate dehydrogenase E2 component (dihydrolipoamide acetyltransferase)
MATDVIMPRVDMTMERGTIRSWSAEPGAAVRAGQTLFVIETDKAAMEIEAPEDGVLAEILVPPGREVPVGTVVALIRRAGAPADTPSGRAQSPPVTASTPVAAAPPPEAHQAPAVMRAMPPAAPAMPVAALPRPRATPLARRLSREHGLDLAAIAGSGPAGRIGRADVEAALARRAAAPLPAAAVVERPGARVAVPFQVSAVLDLAPLDALRARIAPVLPRGRKPGLTAMILRILSAVLARHPAIGAVSGADGGHVDIALALDADGGLATPVLRGADRLRVAGLVAALDALRDSPPADADDAPPPRLLFANPGALGLEDFVALHDGMPVLSIGARRMPCGTARATLSADRATLDPVAAARFLSDLRGCVAAPETVL